MEEQQSEKTLDVPREVSEIVDKKEDYSDKQSEHIGGDESENCGASEQVSEELVGDTVPVSELGDGKGLIIGESTVSDSCDEDKDMECADLASEKNAGQDSGLVESPIVQPESDSVKVVETADLPEHSSLEKDNSQSRETATNAFIQKDDLLMEDDLENNVDKAEIKELPSGGLDLEDISNANSENLDDLDGEPETAVSEENMVQSEETSETQSKDVNVLITDVRHSVSESNTTCEDGNDAEKMSEEECRSVEEPVADTNSKISHGNVNNIDEESLMEIENTVVDNKQTEDEPMDVDETSITENTPKEDIVRECQTNNPNDTDAVPEKVSDDINESTENEDCTEGMAIGDGVSEIAQSDDAVPCNKTDAVPCDETDVIPSKECGTVPSKESDEVACDETDAVPSKESDAVACDEADAVPSEESDAVPSKESDVVPCKEIDAVPCNETDKDEVVDRQEESLEPSDSELDGSSGLQKTSECSAQDTSGTGQASEMLTESVSSENAKDSDTPPVADESHINEADKMGNIEIIDCKTVDDSAVEEETVDEESNQSAGTSKHPTEDPFGTSESAKEVENECTRKTNENVLSDSETAEDKDGDTNFSDQDSITVDEPAELCAVILEEDDDSEKGNDKRINLGEQNDESMEFVQVNDDDECGDSTQENDPFATTEETRDKNVEGASSCGEEQPMEVDESQNSGRSVLRKVLLQEPGDDASGDSDSSKDKPDKVKPVNEEVVNETHEKSDSSSETITGDKQSGETMVQPDDDEEICIIPDTMPRLPNNIGSEKGERGKIITKEFAALPSGVTKEPSNIVSIESTATTSSAPDVKRISIKEESPRRTPGRPQRQAAKRAETQIKELAESDSDPEPSRGEERCETINLPKRVCNFCGRLRICTFQFSESEDVRYFCGQDCFNAYKRNLKKAANESSANKSKNDLEQVFTRKCAQCSGSITGDEKNLSWETMDYCDEECLAKYQKILGSQCANCKGSVAQTSLGKYCVRFGYDVKQFCCSGCLEEFKKGLKVCSYCQKDISGGAEGFLAPVGDKGQFKDFCTQSCMEKYDQMSNHQPPPVVVHHCAVCNNEKVVSVEVIHNKIVNKLCSEPCYAAFKFVNGIVADKCFMCKKYFDKKEVENYAVYSDEAVHHFCCKMCMNVYILGNRKIVPCQWCKVKKYNFDMIKRTLNNGQVLLVCSLNCMTLYQVSMSAITSKRVKCDMCNTVSQAQYHLTMSDATVRNFCTYQCVMQFQGQYSKTGNLMPESAPVPTGAPKRYLPRRGQQNENSSESSLPTKNGGALPVISNVHSLAPNGQPPAPSSANITSRPGSLKINNSVAPVSSKASQIVYKQQVILRPTPPKMVRNKSVFCRPYVHTKGVSCRPSTSTKETQTEETSGKPVLIPVPVPIYVPCPMTMYSLPFPVPVPVPLPIPVPMFIPTTRNSAKGIMKEIKRIQEKIPADPFEAEILMMAEIVAGEKKGENSDSDSDDGVNAVEINEEEPAAETAAPNEESFSPEAVDTSNTEEMLQMALKMASELEEPADLEAALTPSTITPQTQPPAEHADTTESEDDPEPAATIPETRTTRAKKRATRSRPAASGTAAKRRRISAAADAPLLPPPDPPQPRQPEQEKPDANMCLKFTYGVNAWKQWVLTKNAELEKAAASNRKLKLFKPEILQLTADELNYSLCLFVKEVRRPNGNEYAPDTIYYLCLGIQQYLYENGRIDNIFTDPYYEKFTECLDEVARKFSAMYNDAQFIVTRVEEEHLWESRQLGAHSPHVLLSTLLFFNTKHFNLTTVDEHMQLSFSHIMKHWKRNPNQPGASKTPGSRNVLLRFYPPQSALDANHKKKKVYEQQENEENPIRCPVKLYEFYLSKCPESVKTRNDVFYLLPERSCVPDSPVWYSTMALGKEPLVKMLNRVRMVKEINMALLTS